MKSVLLVLVLVGTLMFAGCAGSTPNAPPSGGNVNTPPANTPPAGNGGTGNNPTTASVEISGFKFNAAQLTVTRGTTVTWTNRDSMLHSVTSTTGAFDSKPLQSGGTWSFTFSTPGTYEYVCSIHPDMKGTVIVSG